MTLEEWIGAKPGRYAMIDSFGAKAFKCELHDGYFTVAIGYGETLDGATVASLDAAAERERIKAL